MFFWRALAAACLALPVFSPTIPAFQAPTPPKSEEPRSAAAVKVLKEYEEQIKKLDTEYVTKVREVREKHRTVLEEIRKATLAKGDLDEAQRLLAVEKQWAGDDIPRRGFAILYAYWGTEASWADVTALVRKQVRSGRVALIPEKVAGFPDTAFGKHKSLAVIYSVNGRVYVHIAGDQQQMVLPDPRIKYP